MEIQEKEFEQLESYYELIMAVENKYPNENRHQTALRLIREAQHAPQQAGAVDRAGDAVFDNEVLDHVCIGKPPF